MNLVDKLPITPLLKCHALNLQLRAKLSYLLGCCNVCKTWIKTNLDSLITQRVRQWLTLPPCATAHYIPLPAKHLGLNVILPSMLYELCKTSTSLTLLNSKDPRMETILRQNNNKNILRYKNIPKKEALDNLKKQQSSNQISQLDALKEQSILFFALKSALDTKELESWSSQLALLTPAISCFARKALTRCLPTNSNLLKWNKITYDHCPSCKTLETETHILNNCSVAAMQGRYTWRHNAVLKRLANEINSRLGQNSKLYVDLPGFNSPSELFDNVRPDIVVICGNVANVLELTCCYEKNIVSSKQYKKEKYGNLITHCINPSVSHFSTFTLEVTSLGFVNDLNLNKFCTNLLMPSFSKDTVRKLGEISLRCSYFIFCCRHKDWPTDVSDPYVF
jgi:hypothetical protein